MEKRKKTLESLAKLDLVQPQSLLLPPGLLLNYTYPLNQWFSKTLATGFDAETLEAVILINDIYNGFVNLSPIDWYALFVKIEKINEIIQKFVNMDNSDKNFKSNIVLSRDLAVQIVREENSLIKIVIQKNVNGIKHSVTLDYMEYISLFSLAEFIHLVITYNRSAAPFISSFHHILTHMFKSVLSWMHAYWTLSIISHLPIIQVVLIQSIIPDYSMNWRSCVDIK